MEAEAYLKQVRDQAAAITDDVTEDLDFRYNQYFQHLGRLEAVYMTGLIDTKRYFDLTGEWNKHWPGFIRKEADNGEKA